MLCILETNNGSKKKKKNSGKTVALHIMHEYGFGGTTLLIINLSPR